MYRYLLLVACSAAVAAASDPYNPHVQGMPEPYDVPQDPVEVMPPQMGDYGVAPLPTPSVAKRQSALGFPVVLLFAVVAAAALGYFAGKSSEEDVENIKEAVSSLLEKVEDKTHLPLGKMFTRAADKARDLKSKIEDLAGLNNEDVIS